jgi:aminoglycoside 3-N-acetyltransferase
VKPGDILLVYSSLSSLGWVNGGAEAVVLALPDVLGETGTLVVPTQFPDNSDPANWQHPPVPEE